MKKAYIFLAEGFEDVEALGTLDTLRRGGMDVSLVSITEEPFVVSSHGVAVGVDFTFEEIEEPDSGDILIFPGGMPGTKNLAACKPLITLMKDHFSEGGTLAAICAAPGLVLGQLPSLEGYEMTCFDGFEDNIAAKGGRFVCRGAVASGNLITGRSAGYAVDFGLAILTAAKGEEAAEKVKGEMLLACED